MFLECIFTATTNLELDEPVKAAQTLSIAIVLSSTLFSSNFANAALVVSTDGQTVYDTNLNVTWLANASLSKTNTFGLATNVDLGPIGGNSGVSYIYSGGTMTWGGAMRWIAAMNAANYLGYNDWSLPTTLQPDTSCSIQQGSVSGGYSCNGSQMGELFYTALGNNGYYSTSGALQYQSYGLVNKGPFTNFQSWNYWSSTESALNSNFAVYFDTRLGWQSYGSKENQDMFALAVRPGQVIATPVPAAAWLLGSGLPGLIGVSRRKAA